MRTELMTYIAYPEPTRIPITLAFECPGSCDLPDMILHWLRRERELRVDLFATHGSDEAEVLRSDLAAAELHVNVLLRHGAAVAKMRPIIEGIWI